MWQLFNALARRVFWWKRNIIIRISDEELRSIARRCVGGGKRPLSVVLSEARELLEWTGAELDDALDARLLNAIDNELAVVRLPERLDEMERSMRGVVDAFDPKKDPKK